MSLLSSFYVALGLFLVIVAAVSGWLFRTATASLPIKLIVPTLLVALACWTPWQISTLLGFPLDTEFANLPIQAELIAFVPYDDQKRVDLWLREGEASPRAYSIPLTEQLKKTLRQAQEEQAQGDRVFLAKKGKKRPNGYIDIDGGNAPYELDPGAFSLPAKGPQQ